jgi:hypothetical protein
MRLRFLINLEKNRENLILWKSKKRVDNNFGIIMIDRKGFGDCSEI